MGSKTCSFPSGDELVLLHRPDPLPFKPWKLSLVCQLRLHAWRHLTSLAATPLFAALPGSTGTIWRQFLLIFITSLMANTATRWMIPQRHGHRCETTEIITTLVVTLITTIVILAIGYAQSKRSNTFYGFASSCVWMRINSLIKAEYFFSGGGIPVYIEAYVVTSSISTPDLVSQMCSYRYGVRAFIGVSVVYIFLNS